MKQLAVDYISQHGQEYLDAIGDNPENRQMLIALVTGAYMHIQPMEEELQLQLDDLSTDHWLVMDVVLDDDDEKMPEKHVKTLINVNHIVDVCENSKNPERIDVTAIYDGRLSVYTVASKIQTWINFLEVEQSANISTLNNYR